MFDYAKYYNEGRNAFYMCDENHYVADSMAFWAWEAGFNAVAENFLAEMKW
jgi:hypothetical protein